MYNKKQVFAITIVLMMALIGCDNSVETTGATAISGYEIVTGETAADSTAEKQLQVDCPDSKKALAAGWSALDGTDAILNGTASYFEPATDGTHWLVNAQNNSTFTSIWKLRVRVICADVSS